MSLVNLVCSKSHVDSLTETQLVELFLALLPILIPITAGNLPITKAIAMSDFKKHSPVLQAIAIRESTYLRNHFIHFLIWFGFTWKLDIKQKRDPGEGVVCNNIQALIRQEKAFSTEQLNTILFERILGCILDPSTHPSLSLPAIFVATALIKGESNHLTAARMATRLIDVFSQIMSITKVNNWRMNFI